jgi:hypothetical protein
MKFEVYDMVETSPPDALSASSPLYLVERFINPKFADDK